jgi:hypothetical protein
MNQRKVSHANYLVDKLEKKYAIGNQSPSKKGT